MNSEESSHPERTGLFAGRRKLYTLAAAGVVLAVGVASLIGILARDPAPAIASAGIIQGDVRIRPAGDDDWRQLSGTTARIVAGTGLRSTPSGRIALDLLDRISLRLDAGSEVTLTTEREIELVSGTIYIDSSADAAAAPITVVTTRGTIQAIGAQAAIALLDDALYVSARSGDVELVQDGSELPFAASAGEGLQLLVGDSPRRMRIRTYGSDWAWIETLSSAPNVQGQTLASFLDWITHETGRPLRFDSATTESRAATMTLNVDVEGLDAMQALDIVLSTTDLEYGTRYDGTIVIEPRGDGR